MEDKENKAPDEKKRGARNVDTQGEQSGEFTWNIVRKKTGRISEKPFAIYPCLGGKAVSRTAEPFTIAQWDPVTKTSKQVLIPAATQAEMKIIYDYHPEFAKQIKAPEGYKAPWDK